MIALITPTGGRSIQIGLCSQWMRSQTYQGEVVWIIIDDCIPRTSDIIPENFRDNWTIIKYHPEPSWQPGQNTQGRNLSAGIQVLQAMYKPEEIKCIFIIEDDDYYRPIYLERMMANLNNYYLIGERNTVYYNVYHRRYVTNPNTAHASLFQTAFTPNVIPEFMSCLTDKFIDCVFWPKVQNRNLFYEHDLAVGMKGIGGRYGIGAGHSKAMSMNADINLTYLKRLIGETDANIYGMYYGNQPITVNPFFNKRSL
jgi:hypothetical protein